MDTVVATDAERNKELVRRFFAEVLNEGNLDRIDALVTPDYRLHAVGFPDPMDREAHKGFVATIRAAFPDWRESVEEIVAEGDRVVARVVGRGAHRGEFMGIPATGRQVEVVSVNIDRIADGRIAERWLLPDTLGLLRQIDAVPATRQEPVLT